MWTTGELASSLLGFCVCRRSPFLDCRLCARAELTEAFAPNRPWAQASGSSAPRFTTCSSTRRVRVRPCRLSPPSAIRRDDRADRVLPGRAPAVDRARLIFFASWLVGDFLHLFGTVFSGHAQTTQIALYMCALLSLSLSVLASF